VALGAVWGSLGIRTDTGDRAAMIRRPSAASLVLALALSATAMAPTIGADPQPGSLTLPDGRVLPPMPSELMQPSVHASMLAEPPSAPLELQLADDSKTTAPAEPTAEPGGDQDAAAQTLVASGGSAVGPGGPLPNGLRREVLGFLPYWMLDAESLASMRYDLTSTIAYFSIGASANGSLVRSGAGWTGWNSSAMSQVVVNAHARGVRVVPTITLMSWSGNYTALSSLLNSATYRSRFIGEVVSVIRGRGADGVNIDFEPVPSSLRAAFTSLVRDLKAGLLNAGVGSYLTVDTMAGAATWATGYDLAGLTASGAADAVMVMAYDFSWSGSARAGGVAPLDSPYIFDARQAVADHLAMVDGSKVIWGIPYYGRTWPTQSDALNSLTCRATSPPTCPNSKITAPGASSAYYYTGALAHAAKYGRRWDAVGGVPWYRWYDATNTTWRQGYYDDAASLGLKYDLVTDNGLAGIGIWTLLMDAGRQELWHVIDDRFRRADARLAGADRYATAAAISANFYAPGVQAAFVATGADFPDALAAGPAAARLRGPMLLTGRTSLPSATANELLRLRPQRIVVVGAAGAVSDGVAAQLAAYTAGSVTRLAGSDRYHTAATISRAYYARGVPVAYVATGATFPDALAAGTAAAPRGAPVLLVKRDTIPAATATELSRLRPQRIVVVGGVGAVGNAVATRLASYTTGTVVRLAGADRYETAVAVSARSFPTDGPSEVFVATGANFADGVAGVAAAGARHAPLLLVAPDSLPPSVAGELRRLSAPTTWLLGSTGAISDRVRNQIRALWY
jgi:spore germination protein YaaH/putative cell wall-binding protein